MKKQQGIQSIEDMMRELDQGGGAQKAPPEPSGKQGVQSIEEMMREVDRSGTEP